MFEAPHWTGVPNVINAITRAGGKNYNTLTEYASQTHEALARMRAQRYAQPKLPEIFPDADNVKNSPIRTLNQMSNVGDLSRYAKWYKQTR
jgi:hypothetical protein